jgi:hypothetical protein
VRVGGSVTRNLGDFNSARVEVMMELPCLPEIGEMRRVADLISAQIDEIIPTELEKSVVGPSTKCNRKVVVWWLRKSVSVNA